MTTLLYCLGDEANDILTFTGFTEEQMKIYDTVLTKLNKFFAVRKNVIFDQAKFNTRTHQPGKFVEQFIA